MKTAHEADTQAQPQAEAPKGEVVNFPRGRVSGATPDKPLNDALIRGEDSPEWQALLVRPITFMTGTKADTKVWKPDTRTLAEWLDHEDKSHRQRGLTAFRVEEEKDGRCFVTGASVGGVRKADAMATHDAMGVDFDNGTDMMTTVAKAEAWGIAALVYPTHSHESRVLDPKRDLVLRKLGIDRDPTDEELRQYFREHDTHQYTDEIIDALEIEDPDCLTEDGSRIIARTIPIQKFRFVAFFDETITRQMRGKTDRERKAAWTAAVKTLAEKLGGRLDEAATDASRLFYAPSHRPVIKREMYLVRGRGLRWDEIQPENNAFLQAGADDTERKEHVTPSGDSLTQWVARHGRGFQPKTLLEGSEYDTGLGSGDVLDITCPFGDGHSDSDGEGYVKDADGGGWVWKCQHDSCKGRDRLEYVAEALKLGWFAEEDIAPDSPYIVLSDEELAELDRTAALTRQDGKSVDAGDGEFEAIESWLPKGYMIRGGGVLLCNEGDDKPIPICTAIDVVGRSSNMDGTAEVGRIFSFVNENGERVEKTVTKTDIAVNGKAVIADLTDAGLTIFGRGTKADDRLLDFLHRIMPSRHVPVVPKPGWVRGRDDRVSGFLCPTGEYIAVEDGVVRLHSNGKVRDTDLMGTFKGWQDAAHAAIDVKENFYWTVGVASGFAGPLLDLMRIDPVGFYFSGESGQGKTEAARFAVTAWTTIAPKQGLLGTMDATENAVEDLAVIGSATVCVLDEVGAMKRPQSLPSMLFGLSSGAGKDRKKGRGAGLAETAEFRPFVMMSSERSMRDIIESAGGEYKNGLGRRFPTINTDVGVKVSDDLLVKVKGHWGNFGHAGPMFVRWLIEEGHHEDPEKLLKSRDALTADIVGATDSNRLREAGAVFALVALAGQMAKEAGIIDRDVLPAIKKAFSEFKHTDEGEGLEGDDKVLNEFRAWVNGELDVSIIKADSYVDVDARPRYRAAIGWYTNTKLILDWNKLKKLPEGVNGTRGGLVKALNKIGAVDRSDKNNAHTSLPEEVETSGGRDRKVQNIRIWRGKLGV